jgi:hypothetical protein
VFKKPRRTVCAAAGKATAKASTSPNRFFITFPPPLDDG